MRYHDAENWPLLREALVKMGRADLIGHGPQQLIPPESGARALARQIGPRAARQTAGQTPDCCRKAAVTAASNAEKTGRR